MPGLLAAILLSGVFGLGFGLLLARYPIRETWPAFILSGYLIVPEVSPELLAAVAAVTLVAFGINCWGLDKGFAPKDLDPSGVPRSAAMVFIAITLAFFILYGVTLAPDVLAADSGELQVVAAQLGVAHPPGFPIYVLLAHLMIRLLPMVPPAYAVNLFSAITSALTVGLVFLSGVLITRRWLPAIGAAIVLGSATTFWAQATTANVRSLTGLFAALILYGLISFRIATLGKREHTADRWLIVTALFMGFGLTHHISLLFLILVGLVFILVVDRSLIRQPRRWWRPVGAALLGLVPLLYLPLRAGADVRGASADLATPAGFLEHVLATGFRGDLFYYTSAVEFGQRLGIMANVMTFQFALVLLVAMLAGLILLIRYDRALAWLLGGGFFVYAVVAATYRAPQTVEYMIPAYIPAVLMLAYTIGWLLEWARKLIGQIPDPSTDDRDSADLRRRYLAGLSVAVVVSSIAILVAASLAQLPGHISAAGARHEATSAREYAGRLIAAAPADSIILAHWHWATPLWYLQEVEGRRPDVDVRFVYPEGESYDATWAWRTREAFDQGRPVITTYVPPVPLPDLPLPEPTGEALLYSQTRRDSLPSAFTPLDLVLGETIEVLGYRLEEAAVEPGDELVVEVAWRPRSELQPGVSLFTHLVDAGGQLVGQDDWQAIAAEGLTITQFRLTPRLSASVGSAGLFIGATVPQSSAGESGPTRQLLAGIELIERWTRPLSRNPVHRLMADTSEKVLIGYDWDATLPDRRRLYLHWQNQSGHYQTEVIDDGAIDQLDLPAYRGPWGVPVESWSFPQSRAGHSYVPFGQGIVWTGVLMNGITPLPAATFTLDQVFHSTQALNRDLVVSVRLIGLEQDGYHWAWWDLQDSVPAMGAIPTLKWIDGSRVRSPHQVTVSRQATPGQAITGALTLYDAFTNRPVPILDERITNLNPWVPLGFGSVAE